MTKTRYESRELALHSSSTLHNSSELLVRYLIRGERPLKRAQGLTKEVVYTKVAPHAASTFDAASARVIGPRQRDLHPGEAAASASFHRQSPDPPCKPPCGPSLLYQPDSGSQTMTGLVSQSTSLKVTIVLHQMLLLLLLLLHPQ
ncbi:uncharacterized protein V6R79_004284 [Siganus canaliculatus]